MKLGRPIGSKDKNPRMCKGANNQGGKIEAIEIPEKSSKMKTIEEFPDMANNKVLEEV